MTEKGAVRAALIKAFVESGLAQQNAESLAAVALAALSSHGSEEYQLDRLSSGDYTLCDGYCNEDRN